MVSVAANTAQEDLRDFAALMGIGQIGVNLFAGAEPDNVPDPTATFYNLGSEGDVYIYEQTKKAITTNRVRVWVRAETYGSAAMMAQQIYDLLQIRNDDVGQHFYEMVRPTSEPMPLGRDETGRQQISFSIRTRRNE
jgi:hypothetical protein